MAKNIVILCDGTSNEIAEDRTNVLRLFGALKRTEEQLVFYDPGVGTFGAGNSPYRFQRKTREILGLAFGQGLDQNVKEAYRFLVEHYRHGNDDKENPEPRDRIYIYGFSRGAYTARVLAGFIHTIGLIDKTNMNLLDYAYGAYKAISEWNEHQEGSTTATAFDEVRLYEKALRAVRPPIAMLGLFDTVASVFEWGRRGIRLRTHAFTKTNRSVAAIRHAVSIDETRTMFQPLLWPAGAKHRPDYWVKSRERNQDVKEVWFRGCHGDIGGGYPEKKSGLAKIPLDWMIRESEVLGVLFKPTTINTIVLGKKAGRDGKQYTQPDPWTPVNDSMTGAWPILEYLPRRKSEHVETNRSDLFGWYLPRKERRIIPEGAQVHKSVFDCDSVDVSKIHPNLPKEYSMVG